MIGLKIQEFLVFVSVVNFIVLTFCISRYWTLISPLPVPSEDSVKTYFDFLCLYSSSTRFGWPVK